VAIEVFVFCLILEMVRYFLVAKKITKGKTIWTWKIYRFPQLINVDVDVDVWNWLELLLLLFLVIEAINTITKSLLKPTTPTTINNHKKKKEEKI